MDGTVVGLPIEDLIPAEGSAFVYRLYSASGRLLYVGMTSNLGARVLAHASSSWFPEVATYTFRLYPSRELARLAEAAAIRAECPVVNVVHRNDRSREDNEARLCLLVTAAETKVLELREVLDRLEPEYQSLQLRVRDLRSTIGRAESELRRARRALTQHRAETEVFIAS